MSARPGLCGGHQATGVPTAIANDESVTPQCSRISLTYLPQSRYIRRQ